MRIRLRRFFWVAAAWVAACTGALPGQTAELGFEERGLVYPARPAGWMVGAPPQYVAEVDSTVAHSGRSSLRLQRVSDMSGFVQANRSVPVSLARGKRIHLRGWIRTANVTGGQAAFWVRVDGPGAPRRVMAFDNMAGRGASGTQDWTPYEIELPVDTAATGVYVGVLQDGYGTAWFDDLEIDLDGVRYDPASAAWKPSPSQAAWVRRHAVPLRTDAPGGDDADLRALHPLLAGASVVALGEGTHGTREFFRTKHRLVQWMVEREGVTVFAIEANMPEARRVNEYVLTGRGDPRAALSGLYFWTWNTEEVLALIEWMRAYNASGRGRVEFWGFDMQTPTVAADSVRAFVRRADPAFLPALDSAWAISGAAFEATRQRGGRVDSTQVRAWHEAAMRVLAHLAENRTRYLARFDREQVDWAEQNARIVEQAANSFVPGGASRDSSMAENVAWITAHHPAGTRVALWAHNAHVTRAQGWMGSYLDRRFGSGYRVFGFAMGEGEYTAVGPRGLAAYPASPPAPGSVEAVLRGTGMPSLVLDLRGAAGDRNGGWLAEPHLFRMIGASAMDEQFQETPVAGPFDELIYFDRTTASHILPRAAPPAGP